MTKHHGQKPATFETRVDSDFDLDSGQEKSIREKASDGTLGATRDFAYHPHLCHQGHPGYLMPSEGERVEAAARAVMDYLAGKAWKHRIIEGKKAGLTEFDVDWETAWYYACRSLEILDNLLEGKLRIGEIKEAYRDSEGKE